MLTNVPSPLPFVSVVIPVLDGAGHIADCIESVLAQEYPPDRFETLVVDNGSTDMTQEIVRSFPVRLLVEGRLRSSYAARNEGVRHARGSCIAFLDSDCVAEPRWLTEAVEAMWARGADLVGGNVVFDYVGRPSGAQLFDSITNMQVERNVLERRVAKTANLLVRTSVFESVGRFPDDMTSGGDVTWTASASEDGHELVYAADARVHHPARDLAELLRKQYRVGRGQPTAWMRQGHSRRGFLRLMARTVVVRPRPARIRAELQRRGVEVGAAQVARTWLAGILSGVATAVGMLRSSMDLFHSHRSWRVAVS